MKKLAIISIVGGVFSLALTVGFIIIKLNNDNLFGNVEKKIMYITESKRNESKEMKEDKTDSKTKSEKIESKDNNKIVYIEGKVPNFKGYKQTEVYEFAKKHGVKYELGEAVLTPIYNLKGTIAKQSIEPGKSITKDNKIKISIYVFDGHYDPNNEEDKCHDEEGNFMKNNTYN